MGRNKRLEADFKTKSERYEKEVTINKHCRERIEAIQNQKKELEEALEEIGKMFAKSHPQNLGSKVHAIIDKVTPLELRNKELEMV